MISGEISVTIHSVDEVSFKASQESAFNIRRGVTYKLENQAEEDCRLFYAVAHQQV